MLRIENHGPLIVATNYWDLPEERLGKVLVSPNAGAFRVLLPRVAEPSLEDMKAGRECLVSRGPCPGMGLPDATEILFDDGTNSPFALHLSVAAWTTLPDPADVAKEWVLTAWTAPRRGKPHKALERPCWYRLSDLLPDLRPRTRTTS